MAEDLEKIIPGLSLSKTLPSATELQKEAFLTAAAESNLETLKEIWGACLIDVNIRNKANRTALHILIDSANDLNIENVRRCFIFLILKKSDILLIDSNGESALDYWTVKKETLDENTPVKTIDFFFVILLKIAKLEQQIKDVKVATEDLRLLMLADFHDDSANNFLLRKRVEIFKKCGFNTICTENSEPDDPYWRNLERMRDELNILKANKSEFNFKNIRKIGFTESTQRNVIMILIGLIRFEVALEYYDILDNASLKIEELIPEEML